MALDRGMSHLGVDPTTCFVCGWSLRAVLPGPLARGRAGTPSVGLSSPSVYPDGIPSCCLDPKSYQK